MQNGVKQALKIGLIIGLVVAVAMSGLALAQTGDEPPTDLVGPPEAERDVDADGRHGPGYRYILHRLGPLVEEGTITQSQAEAVAAQLAGPHRRPHGPGAQIRGLVMRFAEIVGIPVDEVGADLEGGATFSEIAEEYGSSAEQVIAELLAGMNEHFAEALANGKVTEEQVERALQNAEARLTELFETEHPLQRLVDHRGDRRQHRRDFRHAQRDIVTELTGLTPGQIYEGFREGKSLAVMAEENGVGLDELVAAMLQPISAQIEEAVAHEKLTAAEAAEKLAQAEQRIREAVTKVPNASRPGDAQTG